MVKAAGLGVGWEIATFGVVTGLAALTSKPSGAATYNQLQAVAQDVGQVRDIVLLQSKDDTPLHTFFAL